MSLASQRGIVRIIRGDENSRREFVAWIKRIRKRAGLTQQEMSALLGRSPTVYGTWESGQHVPGWNLIVRVRTLHMALENATKNGECNARARLQEGLGSSHGVCGERSAP
ncbi:MAG: helix-turn-helix transcriptional regulator [bacterium]